MRRKLSIILCIALVLCMIPTSIFAAKIVKTKSVSLSPKAMVIAVGDIAQLNATKNPAKATDKLTWSTSDKTIATVTKKGVIQGVSEGTATITVKAGKKKATCTVVVKNYLDEDKIRESLREELKAEFATKNDVQTLISQNTYTKSEIDSKIASVPSGGSSGQTPSSIIIIPNKRCTYKSCDYYRSNSNVRPSVNVDTINIEKVVENSYEDFLEMDKQNRKWPGTYWKYTTKIKFTGSIDTQYANEYVDFEFAGEYNDRENWSSGYALIQEDGSFSGTCDLETNYYPSTVTLVWINVWKTLSDE